MAGTALAPGQIVAHPYAYGAHGPGRRQFSVLCWRGWCDNSYRDREIGAMIHLVSGAAQVPAAGLPARSCPTPDTCDCGCHDKYRPLGGPVTWQDDTRQHLDGMLGRDVLRRAPRLRDQIAALFETVLSQHPAWTGWPGFAGLTAAAAADGRAELGVTEEESRTFVLPVPAEVLSDRQARFAACRVLVIRLADGEAWSEVVVRDDGEGR